MIFSSEQQLMNRPQVRRAMFFKDMNQRINDKSLEAKMDYTYGMDLSWLDLSIQGTESKLFHPAWLDIQGIKFQLIRPVSDSIFPELELKCGASHLDKMTSHNMYLLNIDETLKLLMQELKNDSNPIIVNRLYGREEKEFLNTDRELNKKQKDLAVSFENMLIRIYRETTPPKYRDILLDAYGYLHPKIPAHPAIDMPWELSSFGGHMRAAKYFGKNGHILNKREK